MASDYAGRAPYEEDRDAHGSPRPGYEQLLAGLRDVDLRQLCADVARRLSDDGARFGAEPFVVDPVPRLIPASDWERLERGLAQRTRALNAFLVDAYGPRRIVDAGIVEAETIDGAEGYEPDLTGRLPGGSPPAAIIGFDLVRDPDGRFLVLEDNLRTPSGIAYLTVARSALTAELPRSVPRPRPIDPAIYALLRAALEQAAPSGAADPPTIAVLTDGPGNVASYEHQRLAHALGVPLVTADQLVCRADTLAVRTAGGAPQRVDVLYRRTDEDRIRDEQGGLTAVGALLTPAWLAGNLGLVNAFGNGVADDKLVHGHVEDFVRFYLGEEPLMNSVPTTPLDTPEAGRAAIARLRELVIKPRHGHGGAGVVIGSQAGPEVLEHTRARARTPPRGVHRPADRAAVAPPDGDRRPAGAAPCRPAPVRVLRR